MVAPGEHMRPENRFTWHGLTRALLISATLLISTGSPAQGVLPRPEAPPQAGIGRTAAESAAPQWPKAAQAPRGAPNVLLILTDDVGFGASSTFGGPIPTPALSAVADQGLKYNQFHTTAMCSPTRAALLTGRNHHEVGNGRVTESAVAYDGYTSIIPKSAAGIAEILKQNGYATALFGKYHNVPSWETGSTGPFDHWPTNQGFQHFYGFLGGGTNQWSPALFEGIRAVKPPHDNPRYTLESDLADHTIAWIGQQKGLAPERPFFIHYATAAGHAPNHAPKEWLDKFKGKFDQGWDQVREQTLARQKQLGVVPANTVLSARPAEIPAWDSLSADQKAVYARLMEAYAAQLAYSDHQVGRVITALRDMGQLDNTLIIFIEGDNGASGEGGPQGRLNETSFMNGMTEDIAVMRQRIDEIGSPLANNLYPIGWAHAMDTPFQWFKQVASHFGGTRNGMALSWPAKIKERGIRSQFHHVIDVVPTLLDVIGIAAPDMVNGVPQKPISGTSMAYTFGQPDAASTRRTQYFELFGNRAIYHDGWIAASTPVEMPWSVMPVSQSVDNAKWELYNVQQDFSEANNLATQNPEKLRALQDLFWIEAARNQVLPLMLGKGTPHGPPKPSALAGKRDFVFYPGTIRSSPWASPNLTNTSFTIAADVDVPEGAANGVLFTHGGRFGGHGLYLLNGKLVYHYNLLNMQRYSVVSSQTVAPGKHVLSLDFTTDGGGYGKGGLARLLVDGKEIGSGRIAHTVPWIMNYDEGMDIGADSGTPVSEDYRVPFAFNGNLRKVSVTLRK